jgi:hypothetical protein
MNIQGMRLYNLCVGVDQFSNYVTSFLFTASKCSLHLQIWLVIGIIWTSLRCDQVVPAWMVGSGISARPSFFFPESTPNSLSRLPTWPLKSNCPSAV